MINTVRKGVVGNVDIFTVDVARLREALTAAASEIRRCHREVKWISLFGSFSNGTYTPTSDVDVAIIVNETDRGFTDRSEIFQPHFTQLDRDVSIFVYTDDEFQRMKETGNAFVRMIEEGERL